MAPPKHIQQDKHTDHNYIVKRLEKHIAAYRSGKPETLVEFYHSKDFVYSDMATARKGMNSSETKDVLHRAFNDFHDIRIKTLSVHGHKHFTAWEWELTCRMGVEPETRKKLSKEEGAARKLVGYTLMWWDNDDKIIRNHDYVQMRGS